MLFIYDLFHRHYQWFSAQILILHFPPRKGYLLGVVWSEKGNIEMQNQG